jgi:hypothetical protein
MPRHSPNALTSHLRVHTTNDNPDIPAVGMTFSVVVMRMIVFFLSQILHALIVMTRSAANRFLKVNRTIAASIEKPIHNVKVPMNEAEASSKSIRRWKLMSSFLERNSLLPTEKRQEMVEPIGIEPMTPCLQSRCSPS